MDFNPETNVLYTGDEAGYLQKWDLTIMLDKLRANEDSHKARQEHERQRGQSEQGISQAKKSSAQSANKDSTFLTGVNAGESLEEQKYLDEDVVVSEPWKAHEDAINCVTFIPELKMIATCAFDYHVYIWDAED